MDKNRFQILSDAEISYVAEFYKNSGDGKNYPFGKEETAYGMTKISTELLPYASAKLRLSDIYKHIQEVGYTDGTCSISITVRLKGLNLCNLNKCKFILSFDEDMSYKMFKGRENRIGAKSVKSFVTDTCLNDIYNEIGRFDGDGYGVNFTKLQDNLISYGYVGGSGYEKKFVETSTLIDYYICHLYSTLTEPAYTIDEVNTLKSMARRAAELNKVFETYDSFTEHYPNAVMLVDMYPMSDTASVFWTVVKQRVKDLFLCGGITCDTKVKFNYDSDSGAYQIKDTEFCGYAHLSNTDIVDCKVMGCLESCDLYDCTVSDSILKSCSVMGATEIKRSNLSSVYLSDESLCKECRIFGDSILTGKCVKCVVGETAHVSDDARMKDSVNNSNN